MTKTRARKKAIAARTKKPPPQSVAALLPEEILDCVFSHFDFDYSLDGGDEIKRDKILSGISIVAQRWKEPARRLLFRNIRIFNWNHLPMPASEWARTAVRTLRIDGETFDWSEDPVVCSKAFFNLVVQFKNLQSLYFSGFPFYRFTPQLSARMRSDNSSLPSSTYNCSETPPLDPSSPTSSSLPIATSRPSITRTATNLGSTITSRTILIPTSTWRISILEES